MMYIDRGDKFEASLSESTPEQETIVFNAKAREEFPSASKELLSEKGFDSDDFIGSVERVSLKVGDTESVMRYYRSTLYYLRQHNCSAMIRAVIKSIEPQKYAKSPYNGGDLTKPKWWPSSITHTQLEHMNEEDSIELFLHILRKLGCYGVTADILKEIAKQNLWDSTYVQIIYELFRVRKIEERFERDEVDASTVIYVKKASSSAKERVRNNLLVYP
ncbi:uncharacterized protein N7529_000972 [Penicillium soppii]|uniref:uncharacterized protein n=1 Tax=Penicillium soppii TaxID=69789 RepID=UPI0025480694|nr:uncharacterized protein N7529_000972 [Penicillium soppii]KAJ5882300.1 hypothetical protein N7529_000972 [Penicillium soppii]